MHLREKGAAVSASARAQDARAVRQRLFALPVPGKPGAQSAVAADDKVERSPGPANRADASRQRPTRPLPRRTARSAADALGRRCAKQDARLRVAAAQCGGIGGRRGRLVCAGLEWASRSATRPHSTRATTATASLSDLIEAPDLFELDRRGPPVRACATSAWPRPASTLNARLNAALAAPSAPVHILYSDRTP